MAGPIWRKSCQDLRGQFGTSLAQLGQRAGHPFYVVQDDHIGHQLAVLHDLALFVQHVFGDDALTAEEHPLHETIELLALVGRSLDGLADLDVVDVAQQEQGAQDLA